MNDEHVETPVNLDIIMPTYNFLEYSDNYSNTSGTLWQFKSDKLPQMGIMNLIGILIGIMSNINVNNASSFKFKSSILGSPAAD